MTLKYLHLAGESKPGPLACEANTLTTDLPDHCVRGHVCGCIYMF